jgi:hypothetical protein
MFSYSQVEENTKKEDTNKKIIEQNEKIIEQNNQIIEQNKQKNNSSNGQKSNKSKPNDKKAIYKIYTGGNFGLAINSNYTSLIFEPLIGYKLIDKIYIGGKFTYRHSRYYNFETQKFNDYGGSVFTQIYPMPFIFFHFEPAFMNYQLNADNSEREMIPFIWLGGGFRKQTGKNSWVTAKVLFDVYSHPDSPYYKGQPLFSVGVGFGL